MRVMRVVLVIVLAVMARGVSAVGQERHAGEAQMNHVIFVVSVGDDIQFQRACGLAESIRAFAGIYKDAPIWMYGPTELIKEDTAAQGRLSSLGVEFKDVVVPEETSWFILSSMVATAAAAEKDAEEKAVILVYLGNDTIILQQPDEFILPEGVSLGYCPVMHKNISPLYSEPLDSYWSRAYELMQIDESTIFPMVTPADGDTIRPYFNAGCLVVRPERGLLRKWQESFTNLCGDSALREECVQDVRKRIFTFQVALTGAILNTLSREEMMQLSERYNYPIFFKEMFGAKRNFHDITNACTIRYEQFFDEPIPDWDRILQGPSDRISWIKEHYTKK